MTKDQALKFKADYMANGARDFTMPSHFELPDLLEVHIEAVKVVPEDFHKLQGGVLSPKKETTDKFAIAAGVSFNIMAESTRFDKDIGDFIGFSQAYSMGPDGQPVRGDVCDYGFNPEERAEEDMLRSQEKDRRDGKNPVQLTETQKRLKVLEYKKVGRQRANTGARTRATLSVLGLQTGFKDLFINKREEIFLFSRVMLNTKNQLMAQALLNNLAGNTRSLFGPQNERLIDSPRNVTPQRNEHQASDITASSFTPDKPVPSPEVLRMAALQDLLDKYEDKLKVEGVAISKKAIEEQDDAKILQCLNGIKSVLTSQGIIIGGYA